MNKPRIFAITQPLVDGDGNTVPHFTVDNQPMTVEESIVYMARVSSPNQRTEDANKLLLYLIKHSHWSPLDMVDMTMEIHTSRAIMAQILRHWSFRFQEFSQRYAAVEDGIDWSHVEGRRKGDTNRQGSLEADPYQSAQLQEVCKQNESLYHGALGAGLAPECARMILPLATPTRAYMKGSIRSWITYFWQRLDSHAQKEHRDLALDMFAIFCVHFPLTSAIVRKHKPAVLEQDWM